jgi:uncharacterized protein YbaA (DUF1428 family)
MPYVDGFIVAVPRANKEAYIQHAADAFPMFEEFGITRHVEAWAGDLPDGEVTDFRKAVQAKEDEDVVFSWFEYPSREVRDAVGAKMMSDPRMEQMSAAMPFDGKRMVYGGFAELLDHGSAGGSSVDGFVLPVPHRNREAYLALAQKASADFKKHGANRLVEAWGDDVVFSFIEWPDKATRDAAWPKMMADPAMKPDHGNMPFDGKRMFWGGFEIILDKRSKQREPA